MELYQTRFVALWKVVTDPYESCAPPTARVVLKIRKADHTRRAQTRTKPTGYVVLRTRKTDCTR